MVLRPTPLQPVTGYGSPWVERPDRSRCLFLSEDTRLVELPDGRYTVECDDLPEPLELDRAEVVRAAAGVANLVAARLHDHRLAARILDAAIHGDDPATFTRLCIADLRLELDGRGTE